MNNSILAIGSQQDLTKINLLFKEQGLFHFLTFGKNMFGQLSKTNESGILLLVNRRNVVSANKALEYIQQLKSKIPVVVVSSIKDADLLYHSVKVNLLDFIVDCGNQVNLKRNMDRAMMLLLSHKPKKSVLAIGAHPDDIEIGCGGTLLKLKKQKFDINLLTLTKGKFGGDQSKREKEAQNAATFLGARLFIHDLEDTKLSEGNPTIGLIQDAIQATQPDIIYTHSTNDNHQDHRAVHKATLVAARGVDNVLAYQAPSTNVSFHPRHFEVIENYLEDKLTLIDYHRSQTTEKARAYLTKEVIESTANYWGRFANYRYSEPFEVIKSQLGKLN